jgi:hypothetical protein
MGSLQERKAERIELLGEGVHEKNFFDLSKTGVCCHHDKAFDKGAQIMVKINDLMLSAKVAYCTARTDGFRIGMQFVVPPEKQKIIEETVERYSRGVPVSVAIVGQSIGNKP